MTLTQDVRALKTDVHKVSSSHQTLEPFLDAEKLAEILGVDVVYIYSLARAGRVPSLKIGKYRRFSPRDIRSWLERKSRG